MKSSLKQEWIVCRICLQQPKEDMKTIFDSNDESDLTQMILECGGVPIKQFDHYPDKICNNCYKYLQIAHKFRLTCQRSHNHLSKLIAPVEEQKYEEFNDDTESLSNVPLTEDDYVLEEPIDDLLFKLEQESKEFVKEEFTLNSQEENVDFTEIFEPMTEEQEKDFFEMTDEEFENQSTPGSQGDFEYLELEKDLKLPSSDDDDYIETENKKNVQPKFMAKPTQPRASTSHNTKAAKPAKKSVKRDVRKKNPTHMSYECDLCGNKYSSQCRLKVHIKFHKGIKPHECEICGHCFSQTHQLERHMNTHTGKRPYKCSFCNAAFADISTRNKHHRVHTNERPYECDVCGKSFTYTNTLKFHYMIHTGETPFVCEICGKGFKQKHKLRNHMVTHEKKGNKISNKIT